MRIYFMKFYVILCKSYYIFHINYNQKLLQIIT